MGRLRVLIMDDEEDSSLRETERQVRELWDDWLALPLATCKNLAGALDAIGRDEFDIYLLDLKMERDNTTRWQELYGSDDLKQAGGFIAFFKINSLPRALPPIVLLYTASETLKGSLIPFLRGVEHPDFAGRPFTVARKETKAGPIVDFLPALMGQEKARYYLMADRLSACDLVRATMQQLEDRNAFVEDWEDLTECEVAPGWTLSRLFPAWCRAILEDWGQNTWRADQLRAMRELLSERNWLRRLNTEVLAVGKPGHAATHDDKDQWECFAELIQSFPESTRAHMLADLGGQDWDSRPWPRTIPEDDPWEDWKATLESFHANWRVWCPDAPCCATGSIPVTTRVGRDYPTLPGVVIQRLRDEGITTHWAGAHLSGADSWPARFYMDPHTVADEAVRYVRAEILKRSSGAEPMVWLRTIRESSPDMVHLDLIANGTPGFASELPVTVKSPNQMHREMAVRMRGWCEVLVYTHDGHGTVLGGNASRSYLLDGCDAWPNESLDMGEVRWHQVGCMVRWSFHIPRELVDGGQG